MCRICTTCRCENGLTRGATVAGSSRQWAHYGTAKAKRRTCSAILRRGNGRREGSAPSIGHGRSRHAATPAPDAQQVTPVQLAQDAAEVPARRHHAAQVRRGSAATDVETPVATAPCAAVVTGPRSAAVHMPEPVAYHSNSPCAGRPTLAYGQLTLSGCRAPAVTDQRSPYSNVVGTCAGCQMDRGG
jgi:hypothetical protein